MRAALLLLAALPFAGCATDYVSRTKDVRQAYEAYDHAGALFRLEKEAQAKSDRDRLLVLMDKGMLQHADGQFAESLRTLAEAEKLSDQLETVSLSEESSALLSSDRQRAYRGEDFERLMINVLQALNYAALGQEESALVEVRRMNERLRRMIAEEKKPYQQLAVARYLGGALWEDQGEWDSAFIDYWGAYERNPQLGHLAEPLLRLARKTGREAQHAQLRAAFPDASDEPLGPTEGEALVVVEAGLSPQKASSRKNHPQDAGNLVVIPVFKDRGAPGQAKVVSSAGTGTPGVNAVTVTSVRDVAHHHLNDRIGRYLARSLAATVSKAGLAAGAGALTKSQEVGLLTFYLLTLTNEADLRSWLSLPAEFQLVRLRMPAGAQEVTVESRGRTTRHPVEIKPGRITVVVVRRY
jgi:hypothetical protein